MSKSKEFFVVTMSDPAPFCGDRDECYRKGPSADVVLERIKTKYDHPAGLHAAGVYESADAWHKGNKPLAEFKHSCKF